MTYLTGCLSLMGLRVHTTTRVPLGLANEKPGRLTHLLEDPSVVLHHTLLHIIHGVNVHDPSNLRARSTWKMELPTYSVYRDNSVERLSGEIQIDVVDELLILDLYGL
jgi:hypothetical protein